MVAPRYPQITTYNTTDYYQVIRDADKGPLPKNANDKNAGRPDGAVDKNELSAYSGRLQREQRFYQYFGQFFENFLGYNPFEQRLQDINKKLDIAGIMQDRFVTFDGALDGNNNLAVYTGDDRITYREVYNVAGRDGKRSDVSSEDVLGIQPVPIELPEPDIELDMAKTVLKNADSDKNGRVTKQELEKYNASFNGLRYPGYNPIERATSTLLKYFTNLSTIVYPGIQPPDGSKPQAELTAWRLEDVAASQGDPDILSGLEIQASRQERIYLP